MAPRQQLLRAVALASMALAFGHACGSAGDAAPPPAPLPTPSFFAADAASVAPTTEVHESTPRRFRATLHVPGIGAHAVKEGGGTYHALSIRGAGTTRALRRPEVPVLAYHLVLPHLASGAPVPTPVVKVTAGDTIRGEGVDVHPAQRSAYATYASDNGYPDRAPFARDEDAYASDAPFPSTQYEARRIELGGFDVLEVRVLPVRVWPASRRIELARRIELDVDLAPTSEPIEPAAVVDEVDRTGAIVRAHEPPSPLLDNAPVVTVTTRERFPLPAAPDGYDDPLYEYLVVTAPDFAAEARALAQHKRDARGMGVKVALTDEIAPAGGLTAEALRAFVSAEWRDNRLLGSFSDASEADVRDENDLRRATFYLHRARSGATMLGADIAVAGTSPTAKLILYVDADRDGETDFEVSSYPPHATFAVKRRTAPGVFDDVVHTGSPVVRSDGLRYEVPWELLRVGATAADRLDVHVVALDQPLDRLPDAGKVTLERTAPPASIVTHTSRPPLRYLLLLGDVEHIPLMTTTSSWEVMGGPGPGETMLKIVTDHYYASLDDDLFPEISVGRLPVDTAAEAARAVDKIIRYESDDPFTRISPRVATVAPFDDGEQPEGTPEDAGPLFDGKNDTFFVDAVERVRDYFKARGNATSAHYSANVSVTPPAQFNDGRPLPADLLYPGYAWNTGPVELKALFGAYDSQLVIHVDHGHVLGWGGPPFVVDDVAGIATPAAPMGGIYPVVFSLNCASGYIDPERDRRFFADGSSVDFDSETWTRPDVVSFAEALVRHPGGAVSVVAATRMSSVVYNNHLLDGLVRSLYPGYPTYREGSEPRGTTHARALGEMLDDAKLYVDGVTLTIDDAYTDYTFKSYQELYHVFGDPSLRVQRLPRP